MHSGECWLLLVVIVLTVTRWLLVHCKKLSYCSVTARRIMLVNSCYVSRNMGAQKVSNSKSDHQGHSRALEMVPLDIGLI